MRDGGADTASMRGAPRQHQAGAGLKLFER
jgi:hypothetical protein